LFDSREYASYIGQSLGEFSCAKPSCIRLQNAWLSDRTLCYLAAGKPAVVQHTGPSRFIPEAAGLFRFHDLPEAVSCLEGVMHDYENQCRLARALVEERFDARKVAAQLLQTGRWIEASWRDVPWAHKQTVVGWQSSASTRLGSLRRAMLGRHGMFPRPSSSSIAILEEQPLHVLDLNECISAISDCRLLSERSALLTFDDGYRRWSTLFSRGCDVSDSPPSCSSLLCSLAAPTTLTPGMSPSRGFAAGPPPTTQPPWLFSPVPRSFTPELFLDRSR